MSSEHKTVQDITHGIVAIRKEKKKNEIQVLHFCGYFEEPSLADYEDLRKELTDDSEFGLVDQEFELVPATEQMIAHVKSEQV
jgi:hypothetical protein